MKRLLLIISLCSLGFVGLQQISADNDIFPIEKYSQAIREFTGYMSFGSIQRRLFTKKEPCMVYQETDQTYVVSPSCLVQGADTGMSTDKAIALLFPKVRDMNIVYNTVETQFTYQPTTPIFDKRIFPSKFMGELDISFLAYLQKEGKNIRISNLQMAYLLNKSRSRYAVWKDMTPLKSCTKQNYYVAFNALENQIILPSDTININDIISYLGGYCKGTGPKNLMFYGGVCGAATQLFRLSLIVPDFDVIDRYGHSIWYVPYYSDYVFGDDAALYQNSKKLILQNNSAYPIYLKTISSETSTYLIAIVPNHTETYVKVIKEQTANLSSKLIKNVYSPQNTLIKSQEFVTTYAKKSYTVN